MTGLPLDFGLSKLTLLNFFVVLIDALFSNFMYSDLSITTIPVPLSGLVITMSFSFLSWFIDRSNVFGGDVFLF